MPSFVAGLKNGWAFAWRSLMAGELIVIIAFQASLGQLLQVSRELFDAKGLLAVMIVILTIGILIDALVFGTIERRIREKRAGRGGAPGPACPRLASDVTGQKRELSRGTIWGAPLTTSYGPRSH